MIQVPAGVHLSTQEVRLLLAVLESACRVAKPDARALHVIDKLRGIMRQTDAAARNVLRSRANHGGDAHSSHYAQFDLVDTAEAGRLLGISAAGVRDLVYRRQLPGHRAGGRWLLPAASVIERAEWQAARRAG